MPICRLLPDETACGPLQMAGDDVLLHSATQNVASLRFYTWTEPTLSLGYFQPAGPARQVPELASLAWLRRPSGGAALVHHHEMTYALAVPSGNDWQPAGQSWLVRWHRCIQTALAKLGVTVRLAERDQVFGEVLCFLHHTPGDLLLGACKVVGSAQRKQRGALLQHGSILLQQSLFTPLLPGICDLSGRSLSGADLQSALLTVIRQETGWQLEPGTWTEAERIRRQEVAANRYLSSTWNEKR